MAASLAAELKERLGVIAELVGGSGGVFVVEVDGAVVFDKAKTGRFPRSGELNEAIEGSADGTSPG